MACCAPNSIKRFPSSVKVIPTLTLGCLPLTVTRALLIGCDTDGRSGRTSNQNVILKTFFLARYVQFSVTYKARSPPIICVIPRSSQAGLKVKFTQPSHHTQFSQELPLDPMGRQYKPILRNRAISGFLSRPPCRQPRRPHSQRSLCWFCSVVPCVDDEFILQAWTIQTMHASRVASHLLGGFHHESRPDPMISHARPQTEGGPISVRLTHQLTINHENT